MLNLKLFLDQEPYRYLEQNRTQINNVMSARYVCIGKVRVLHGHKNYRLQNSDRTNTLEFRYNQNTKKAQGCNNKPMQARVSGPTAADGASVTKSTKY
jgi:hypothetical protein